MKLLCYLTWPMRDQRTVRNWVGVPCCIARKTALNPRVSSLLQREGFGAVFRSLQILDHLDLQYCQTRTPYKKGSIVEWSMSRDLSTILDVFKSVVLSGSVSVMLIGFLDGKLV